MMDKITQDDLREEDFLLTGWYKNLGRYYGQAKKEKKFCLAKRVRPKKSQIPLHFFLI